MHILDHCHSSLLQETHNVSESGPASVIRCKYKTYIGRKMSTSLGYVSVRGEVRMERARGGGARRLMRYRFPSLPVPRLAGQQLVYL
jgi:hypothetical protein